jgi:hypothetical protein
MFISSNVELLRRIEAPIKSYPQHNARIRRKRLGKAGTALCPALLECRYITRDGRVLTDGANICKKRSHLNHRGPVAGEDL